MDPRRAAAAAALAGLVAGAGGAAVVGGGEDTAPSQPAACPLPTDEACGLVVTRPASTRTPSSWKLTPAPGGEVLAGLSSGRYRVRVLPGGARAKLLRTASVHGAADGKNVALLWSPGVSPTPGRRRLTLQQAFQGEDDAVQPIPGTYNVMAGD